MQLALEGYLFCRFVVLLPFWWALQTDSGGVPPGTPKPNRGRHPEPKNVRSATIWDTPAEEILADDFIKALNRLKFNAFTFSIGMYG
jgi:hypothetical protein